MLMKRAQLGYLHSILFRKLRIKIIPFYLKTAVNLHNLSRKCKIIPKCPLFLQVNILIKQVHLTFMI